MNPQKDLEDGSHCREGGRFFSPPMLNPEIDSVQPPGGCRGPRHLYSLDMKVNHSVQDIHGGSVSPGSEPPDKFGDRNWSSASDPSFPVQQHQNNGRRWILSPLCLLREETGLPVLALPTQHLNPAPSWHHRLLYSVSCLCGGTIIVLVYTNPSESELTETSPTTRTNQNSKPGILTLCRSRQNPRTLLPNRLN